MEQMDYSKLIARFLDRETTDGELAFLREWLMVDKQNMVLLRKAYEAHRLLQFHHHHHLIDTDKAWEQLSRRLGPVADNHKKLPILPVNVYWWMGIAATILLILGFTAGWWFTGQQEHQPAGYVEFYAPPGEKSKVALTDGSTVWLNAGSYLVWSPDEKRRVKLRGEAYFDVTSSPANPFYVETPSGMEVKVLGTRFNVGAYPDDQIVETTVESGVVAVNHRRFANEVVLAAGEQLLFDQANEKVEVRKVDAYLYTLWKNNTLKFDNAPFEEVVRKIERWYGIEVHLDSELKYSERFTMTIKTESMRELLQMLQLTVKMRYKIDGEKVFIMKR